MDLRYSLDHLGRIPLSLSNPNGVRYWSRVKLGYEESDEQDFNEC